MPIQPTYPGVYIQEVPSGVRTITGVSTSIGAFFGRTQLGPIDKAIRCLSYADFLRNFGGPHPLSDLGASVQHFFINGGTDCYVVRLAKNPRTAAITLRNVAQTAALTRSVLTATAKAPGTWGQGIKLSVDYNTANPEDTFNLTVSHEAGNVVMKTETFNNLSMNPRSQRFAPPFVTQSSSLIDLKLHAEMEDPDDTLTPSFINHPTNTPRGFSQSRRVFTGANADGLRNAMRAAIQALVGTAVPLADRKSKFILNLDSKSENDIEVDLSGIPIPFATASASITRSGTTATVTTSAAHGRATDDFVEIAGATESAYNGTHPITVTGNSTFTFAVSGSPLTPATGTIIWIQSLTTDAMLTDPIEDRIDAAIAPKLAGVTVTVKIDPITTPAPNPNGGVLRITSNDTAGPNVTIRSAAANDFAAPMMFGVDNGGIEVARFSNLRPAPNGLFFKGGNPNDLTEGANGLDIFAGIRQDATTRVSFDGAAAGTPGAINLNLVTSVGSARNFVDAVGGSTGLIEKLRRIQQTVNADVNSPYTAELWGYRLAFKKKSGAISDTGTVAFTGGALGPGFGLNTRRYSLGNLTTSPFQVTPGTDGSDRVAPGQTEYEGDPVKHTGFYALDKVDLFNLMVLPGDREYDVTNVRGPASNYCESRRAFLVLDAPATWTVDDHPNVDAITVNTFRIGVSKQHSAIFFPRAQYNDGGIKKYIGASGMIAGLMARIDSQRGVWKAPAGIEADLRGLTDLELNMTDAENGVLNKLGVNCLRKFPNGIVSWGARTLDGSDDFGSEWKYVPIRRLALFIEESLFRGTKWVVFEPNDEPLWAKIRLNITAFMMGLFRQGAFQGSTPDKAFFVKCDGETTTANDRNLGIVNIQVGFAPLKPAEFVIITIQQIPDV